MEHRRRPTGKPEDSVLPRLAVAEPAVARVLARPEHLPFGARRRREQRLGRRAQLEILPEVGDEQPIAGAAQEAQEQALRPEHGAMYEIGALSRERRIRAPEREQIPVKVVCLAVRRSLVEIELAALERVGIRR